MRGANRKTALLKRRWIWWLWLLPNLLFLSIPLSNWIWGAPKPKPISQVILDSKGQLINATLSSDQKWRMETRPQDLSPELLELLLAKEDKYFWLHSGLNPLSVFRAAWSNLSSGKRTSGASTITMQLSKMLKPRPRTFGNKLLEVLYAFRIEQQYTKQEILQMYLTHLPYGGNIEGIMAASYIYAGKPPRQLSTAEAVTFTVIPNRPNSLRPDNHREALEEFRNIWLDRFASAGHISPDDAEEAKNEPIALRRRMLPRGVPHLARRLYKMYPDQGTISSSIQTDAQQRVENILKNYVNQLLPRNITNGSVLVINNHTMEVVAYCGSADFDSRPHQGQVDAVASGRSPGSTLKPMLYALGMDRGIVTPQMRMMDIPTNINGYTPDNYESNFSGWVTMEQALHHSLNIPPVRLLHQIGMEPFLALLGDQGGFKHINKRRDEMGLSMILGACEASLEELTHHYSAFANEGKLRPIHYTRQGKNADTAKEGNQIYDAETAWILAHVMSMNTRPDFPTWQVKQGNVSKIAWKTGTSYGRRDAWAIGFNADYTIGVWMGNMDGSGSSALSGSHTSVPLLFSIFGTLQTQGAEIKWFTQPKNAGERMVCSESGLPAGPLCSYKIKDYYVQGVSSGAYCNYHKEYYVDEKKRMHYCQQCRPASGYKVEVYPEYPAELLLWRRENQYSTVEPPAHNPQCQAKFGEGAPTIMVPNAEETYMLDLEMGQKSFLQAISPSDTKIHYWYVNQKLMGKVPAGEKLIVELREGDYEVMVMDDRGRKSTGTFKIREF